MLILDANVWIAFLHKEDSQHKKALEIFDFIEEKVFMPEYILVEILNILQLKANNNAINIFLEILENSSSVEMLFSNKDFLYYMLHFFKNNNYPKLSFIDQSLLMMSKDYKIITFDKNLNKAITNFC